MRGMMSDGEMVFGSGTIELNDIGMDGVKSTPVSRPLPDADPVGLPAIACAPLRRMPLASASFSASVL